MPPMRLHVANWTFSICTLTSSQSHQLAARQFVGHGICEWPGIFSLADGRFTVVILQVMLWSAAGQTAVIPVNVTCRQRKCRIMYRVFRRRSTNLSWLLHVFVFPNQHSAYSKILHPRLVITLEYRILAQNLRCIILCRHNTLLTFSDRHFWFICEQWRRLQLRNTCRSSRLLVVCLKIGRLHDCNTPTTYSALSAFTLITLLVMYSDK